MIDIHMLTLPTDNPVWKQQMLDSLPTWATVHQVPASVGPIGPQRLAAFRLGTHPYVSFVDPDDWTEKAIWDNALEAMKQAELDGYSGVVTREIGYELDPSGGPMRAAQTPYKHHFLVVKRQFIEDREALFRYDMLDKDIFASDEIRWLDKVGYHWRRYRSAGMAERIARQARNQK